MQTYTAAIIGCGQRGAGRGGAFGIAEAHAQAYLAHPQVTLVAAADINAHNLQAFCDDHGTRGYLDYKEMLEKEQVDIVSVCTWPSLHAEMTVQAAETSAKAVWCEKPMALSMAEIDGMLEACARNKTLLQVNHLRRFAAPFQAARDFIRAGRLGTLTLVEAFVPEWDLLSWGTHWVDMIRYFVGEQSAQWVMAQIDCREGKKQYGHYVEDHSVTYIAFADGVRGLLELGKGCDAPLGLRVHGSKGYMEVNDQDGARALVQGEAQWLTLSDSTDFRTLPLAALNDLIKGLDEPGYTPLLNGESARATSELILAAYESAYRRGCVALPLLVKDFPLARLIAVETATN